jgi:hypothetical protein
LALGVLAFVVGLVLVVVMAFTVVLMPVSLLALVAVGVVAVMVGWSALGIALGTRVARALGGGRATPWTLRLAVAARRVRRRGGARPARAPPGWARSRARR